MNATDFLADLPSDAFASSSSPSRSPTKSPSLASPANSSHHVLAQQFLKTWIFPTNIGNPRDYQYNIVSKALYQNTLVALPTGLGKTFIAATVMLNWFRWTKDAQIVFVAPTKPLVSQQVDACFNTVGIPRSETTMLTGGISPGLRAEQWASKRVFFMTPQTIVNDLKTGICDPKKIVLVVVDEAHRATGSYAYVEIVKFIRRFNPDFRVLALTATPGSSVEMVQEVISNLEITKVEIRTEFSIDIQQYVHRRNTETVLFDASESMELVMDLFSQSVRPVLGKLSQFNAYWSKDPLALSAYGLTKARQQWMASPAGRSASMGVKGMINKIFSVLASLAHGIDLLKYHGIVPFYNSMAAFQSNNTKGTGGKYQKEILQHPSNIKMMAILQTWMKAPDFIGHPKLEYLLAVVCNHFLDAGVGLENIESAASSKTRIMIFAHFRDSAEEIVRVLDRHRPTVRSHVFVGQATSKGSEGMDQKKQLEIIQQFKTGVYNTLVATSIGEEGLDIGEVDLIVCYDSSASPIRMLQRMGRTGRKRAGKITLLLMRGKEESSFTQAKDNYRKMQEMIASGTRFVLRNSSRILPKHIKPAAEKRVVDIPLENSQTAGLPEPKANSRSSKRLPKKFHMPDGVETGFLAASSLQNLPITKSRLELSFRISSSDEFPVPDMEKVILAPDEEIDHERRYRKGTSTQTEEMIFAPSLGKHPVRQRKVGPTRYVRHGRATYTLVGALNAMHQVGEDCIRRWQCNAKKLPLDEERDWIYTQDFGKTGNTVLNFGSKNDAQSDTELPELVAILHSTERDKTKRQLHRDINMPAANIRKKRRRVEHNVD